MKFCEILEGIKIQMRQIQKTFKPHYATTFPVPSIRLACQTCNVDIITFEWHVISSHKEIQGVSGPDKGWITV